MKQRKDIYNELHDEGGGRDVCSGFTKFEVV